MATGIVSSGLRLDGATWLADLLLVIAGVAFVVLIVLNVWRLVAFTRRAVADFFDPQLSFGYFTVVAAAGVLASGVAARLGLVFKAATTIEAARQVSHVVFDKTGTLTTGQLEVVESVYLEETIPCRDGSSVSTASLVAALASASKHPVARAIAASLNVGSTSNCEIEEIEEITSQTIPSPPSTDAKS